MSKGFIEDTTLTAIGNAIREKTGNSELLLPSEMPSAIQSIETGGGQAEVKDWAPEPDWWDIKTIIENDTEAYGQKVIFLLTDLLDDKSTTNSIKGFEYYKTSDGQAYNKGKTETFDISNIFDITKNKECSKGYKTKYIIGYTNSKSVLNFTIPMNAIYIIASNIKYNSTFSQKYYLQAIEEINTAKLTRTNFSDMFSSCYSLQSIPQLDTSSGTSFDSMFNRCYSLQSIPQLDTSSGTNFYSMFNNCYSLQSIPQLDTSSGTNFNSMFSYCSSLQSIPQLDTSSGTSFMYMFSYCYSLQSIPQLDTSSGTNFINMFSYCPSLTKIGIIGSIKNNLSVSNSNYIQHSTLLKILNALIDNTGSSAKRLTLGGTNLNKLTDEEKAIATNKNWTIS